MSNDAGRVWIGNSQAQVYIRGFRMKEVLEPLDPIFDPRTPAERALQELPSKIDPASIRNDLIQCRVRGSRNPTDGGTGGFSLVLKPRREYLKFLNVGDWVRIRIDNGAGQAAWWMYGCIDSISLTKSAGARGASEETVVVVGRDWSKILASTELLYDTQLGQLVENNAVAIDIADRQGFSGKATLSPGSYVRHLVSIYTGGVDTTVGAKRSSIKQFLVPAGEGSDDFMTPTEDRIRYMSAGGQIGYSRSDDQNKEGAGEAPPVAFNFSGAGTLLNLLNNVSNRMMNELWFDTFPDRAVGASGEVFSVIHREYPYSRSSFMGLFKPQNDSRFNARTVTDTETVSVSLSKSYADVRNWFRINLASVVSRNNDPTEAGRLGYLIPQSITMHGMRRMEFSTPYFWDGENLITGTIDKWLRKQVEWFWQNDKLLSGNIVCRLRPDIRPGMGLRYVDGHNREAFFFYVDSVEHVVNYPGASFTTIQVSRGVKDFSQLLTFDELSAKGYVMPLASLPLSQSFGGATTEALQRGIDPRASPKPDSSDLGITLSSE